MNAKTQPHYRNQDQSVAVFQRIFSHLTYNACVIQSYFA